MALRDLVAAFDRCRRGKRAAPETQAYSAHLLDHLLATRDGLNGFQWQPSPCVAFLCTRPKLREIHAAPFPDRVVHHLLIERWAALLEPGFIADSYANRRGKGTHVAVDRVQGFLRRARHGGGPVWVLKLDVASFFHSVDRRRLARVLRAKLARAVERCRIAAAPAALAKLQAGLASWLGHFRHAAAGRLWQRLCSRFAWLRALFIDVDVALHGGLRPRWRLPRPSAARSPRRQVDAFFSRTRLRRWLVQGGRRYWLMAPGSGRPLALLTPARARGWAAAARAAGTPFGVLVQCGWQRDGRRERQLAAGFQPVTAPNASHPFALSSPSAGVN